MHRKIANLSRTVAAFRDIFFHNIFFIILVACSFQLTGCKTISTNPRYQAQESLLEILSDLKRFQYLDPYEAHIPKELSGQNIYKASLVRLENYRSLYPKRFDDLVFFAGAEAYERLGEYEAAIEQYENAAEQSEELKEEAQLRIDLLKKMVAIRNRKPPAAPTLVAWFSFLEQKARDWESLSRSIDKDIYKSCCRIEWEQSELDHAEMYWRNRDVVNNGTSLAIKALQEIIDEHKRSKRYQSHKIRLGFWYFELAREYADHYPPAGAQFEEESFNRLVNLSRKQFLAVDREYGSRYRREARANLNALEAFVQRVRIENQ